MYKKFSTRLLLAVFTSAFVLPVQAQLKLPAPSPGASVTHTIGLTEITIDYSCPGVKGRKIFGELVPFNKIWRTGANEATRITFSRDVMVEGQKVPKGKYAILTITKENGCTVIFSKNTDVSTDSYKQEEDLVRFEAKSAPAEMRERMTFIFSNFTESQATINLEWERTRISFNVTTDTDAQARENIDKEIGRTWRTYNSAGINHLDTNKELDKGMKYVDQSLALKEEWFNTWTKAQLFHAMGKSPDDFNWAMKAKTLGDKNPDGFFFKDNVEKAIVDWKPKK